MTNTVDGHVRIRHLPGGAPPKLEESSLFRHPMGDGEWTRELQLLKNRLEELGREPFRMLATRIEERIGWLDPVMDRYCRLTCHACEDPCCRGRKVFFNRADMLYLAALQGSLPQGQTRSAESDSCRYLGPCGCTLPRVQRPYVCVWFICEPQMVIFLGEAAPVQRKIIGVLQQVREARLQLESFYERHFTD